MTDERVGPAAAGGMISGDASTELSANRTAMSFERTAMSSDRTLMSVVRTALSLIGFGFTIYSFFHSVAEHLDGPASSAPQRFSLILIVLGMLLLALGIGNQFQETAARRRRRARLHEHGLMHHSEPVTASTALVVAMLLFVAGLLAILHVAFRLGPL